MLRAYLKINVCNLARRKVPCFGSLCDYMNKPQRNRSATRWPKYEYFILLLLTLKSTTKITFKVVALFRCFCLNNNNPCILFHLWPYLLNKNNRKFYFLTGNWWCTHRCIKQVLKRLDFSQVQKSHRYLCRPIIINDRLWGLLDHA